MRPISVHKMAAFAGVRTIAISHTDPYPATCRVTHVFGCDFIFSIVYFIAASFSLARLNVSIAN